MRAFLHRDSPTRIESDMVVAVFESVLENISHPISGNFDEH
jgi:hypothetical protein